MCDILTEVFDQFDPEDQAEIRAAEAVAEGMLVQGIGPVTDRARDLENDARADAASEVFRTYVNALWRQTDVARSESIQEFVANADQLADSVVARYGPICDGIIGDLQAQYHTKIDFVLQTAPAGKVSGADEPAETEGALLGKSGDLVMSVKPHTILESAELWRKEQKRNKDLQAAYSRIHRDPNKGGKANECIENARAWAGAALRELVPEVSDLSELKERIVKQTFDRFIGDDSYFSERFREFASALWEEGWPSLEDRAVAAINEHAVSPAKVRRRSTAGGFESKVEPNESETAMNTEGSGFRAGDSVLSLRKPDGTLFENIKAHLSPKAILVMDVNYLIEEGDMLIHTLPDGLRVGFIVDDPGYREALGSIPARFEVKAHRAAPIDSLKASNFWRTLRAEFEQLSIRQREALGIDREHQKWLRGYCSRLDDPKLSFCEIDGGLDPESRSKFEDTATQAGIALGSPPGADAVEFWLSCLCLDLLQNSPERAPKELWQSVPGGGIIHDLLMSSAAYCSRLAAMADRKANEKSLQRFQSGRPSALFSSAQPQPERTMDNGARPKNGEKAADPEHVEPEMPGNLTANQVEMTSSPADSEVDSHLQDLSQRPEYVQVLDAALNRNGLTIPQLAAKIQTILKGTAKNGAGADRTTVYRIIRGTTKRPQPAVRNALIEALDLDEKEALVVLRAFGAPGVDLRYIKSKKS